MTTTQRAEAEAQAVERALKRLREAIAISVRDLREMLLPANWRNLTDAGKHGHLTQITDTMERRLNGHPEKSMTIDGEDEDE